MGKGTLHATANGRMVSHLGEKVMMVKMEEGCKCFVWSAVVHPVRGQGTKPHRIYNVYRLRVQLATQEQGCMRPDTELSTCSRMS